MCLCGKAPECAGSIRLHCEQTYACACCAASDEPASVFKQPQRLQNDKDAAAAAAAAAESMFGS